MMLKGKDTYMASGSDAGNSKRANIRLDHMESDLSEIKELAKERNQIYIGLCQDMAGLKMEMRLLEGLIMAVLIAVVVQYFVS